jgi:hypothetical protein
MKPVITIALVVATISIFGTSAAAGGPITKQNGGTPVFTSFTSICSFSYYADYGFCAGGTSRFPGVSGRINAVQPKAGVWNLGLTFANLQPGSSYTLWGSQAAPPAVPGVVIGFFAIGTVVAGLDGTAQFNYQTTAPGNLGFDLNLDGYTIVTSYWSNQRLQVRSDGTLYVPAT